ncbi:MAG TPA: septum formation initiator family protein [Chitinophagaceae bacterium]|nr:septum formation initiator family protein [Chitinophagaceae bacterium]
MILTKIPAFLRNKYLIATVLFVVFIVFFDDRDIISNFRHTRELKDLEKSQQYYQEEIAKTRQELKQLRTDAALLEKYAREKYLMKRDNEDLFLVKTRKE